MNLLSRHAAFTFVLVVYAAMLAIQIDHGLASGDGHGIVRSVQTLLDNGQIDVSRPPGHPTTELYLFGGIGWILLDFGLLFLLISFRLLLPPTNVRRLSLSIFSLALATGCRPELVFAAIIFPIYSLLDSKLGWKWALSSIGLLALAILMVWLPIMFGGIRAPYTAGMNLRESILGGAYRIVFQAFTPAVFLLLGWTLVASLRDFRKELATKNFTFAMCCVVAVIFLAVFFIHPSKAAHLLAAVPFLLILAVGRSFGLPLALSFFSVLSCFVSIDIFKDRQLARPYFTGGSYSQAVDEKPYYKIDYLRKLLAQCEDRPAAIIGNAWQWDFEYHMERNNFSAQERDLHGEIKHDLPTFFSSGEHCVFLSPEAAFETALLKEWQQKGYAMKMDAKLYRTLFARYDVRSALASGTVDVGGIPFALFHTD